MYMLLYGIVLIAYVSKLIVPGLQFVIVISAPH